MKLNKIEREIKPLSEISTAELVDELTKREGVKKITVAPYEKKTVNTEGPTVILEVID